ncbi:hypothetical protein [Halomonas sp. AOP42-E1-30]|uniref:hypothetical protein n=1 Tax=Halomonas sp. AOP42-E1-30 TaxID=3457665 RepID=UPI004034A0C3
MTKGKALAFAWAAPIAAIIFLPILVENNVSADQDTIMGISWLLCSVAAGGLAMLSESRKSKPKMSNIATLFIFSYIGLGIATYDYLIDERD